MNPPQQTPRPTGGLLTPQDVFRATALLEKSINEAETHVSCPFVSDSNPSCHIKEADDESAGMVFHCFASCGQSRGSHLLAWRNALHGAGELPQREEKKPSFFEYRDGAGKLLTTKTRSIDANGRKTFRFEPAGVKVSLYRLEDLSRWKGQRLFIVEGEKCVEALRAFGLHATTSGGATTWKDEFADIISAAGPSEVVILPDHDAPGDVYGKAVAASLGARGIPFRTFNTADDIQDPWDGWDVSDWIENGGTAGELLELVEGAPFQKGSPPGRQWESAADLRKRQPRREVVQGIGPVGGIGTLTAESGAGKSFTVIELAYAVGTGSKFFDLLQTELGSVVYLPFESDDVRTRIEALEVTKGRPMENVYVLPGLGPLNSDKRGETAHEEARVLAQIRDIASELEKNSRPPIRLLLIDTVRASMAGDESSSKDASEYLRVVRRIQREAAPESFVLLNHHTGWLDGDTKKKRERGSSDFRGNVETSIYLEKTGTLDGNVTLTLLFVKVRDSKPLPPVRLVRKTIQLDGVDQWGASRASCVVVKDPRTDEQIRYEERRKQDAEESILLDQLLEALRGMSITSKDEIGPAIGVSRNKGREILIRGQREGLITRPRKQSPYRPVESAERIRRESANHV
jgi:hypothetical protein